MSEQIKWHDRTLVMSCRDISCTGDTVHVLYGFLLEMSEVSRYPGV